MLCGRWPCSSSKNTLNCWRPAISPKSAALTGCDDEILKAAQALITSLNPRPGARFAQIEARYITPDVIVKKLKGKWTAYINPDAYPRLRINRLYAEILAKPAPG